MNIGIIGAGNVGGSLGKAWTNHQIMFGVRDAQSDKVQALLAAAPHARAGSVKDAVAFGDVVVLAARPDSMAEVIASGGDWTDKMVIDAMNRFSSPPPDSTGSVAEDVARLAKGAKVVKAFNTIGAENFGNPTFDGQAATMFICGDDDQAKEVVADLAEELGFEVVDVGPLSTARMLEELARLWVHLSRQAIGRRDIGFKLLRG